MFIMRTLCAVMALSTLLPVAQADVKPLRLIVAYPPGGSPDNLARTLAEKLFDMGKYVVTVDNRPGAGGAIAANVVKSAPADGSTLLLTDSSTYSIAPSFRKSLTYDPLKDFKPVGLAATSPLFLISHPKHGDDISAFLTSMREKQPAIASSGNGTAHHFLIEMIRLSTGLDILHVPYRGSSQTVTATAAGDVDAAFSGLTNAEPLAKSGMIRILAVAEPTRSDLAPNIPTLVESGLPGAELTITLGFLAPAATPDSVVEALNNDLARALESEDVRAKLRVLGVEPAISTPTEFGQKIESELQRFIEIANSASITD